MSPITRTATPAAVVLLLAALAPARAERDPDDRCAAAIQRASGQLANCLPQSDAAFVVSEKAERYEKKVGRCEDDFARRHWNPIQTRRSVLNRQSDAERFHGHWLPEAENHHGEPYGRRSS